MEDLVVRKKEGLTAIGKFKCSIDSMLYEECGWATPREDGILYTNEKGNMVAALPLYIKPNGYWDDGGIELKYVLVIPEEDVFEIELDKDDAEKY